MFGSDLQRTVHSILFAGQTETNRRNETESGTKKDNRTEDERKAKSEWKTKTKILIVFFGIRISVLEFRFSVLEFRFSVFGSKPRVIQKPNIRFRKAR